MDPQTARAIYTENYRLARLRQHCTQRAGHTPYEARRRFPHDWPYFEDEADDERALDIAIEAALHLGHRRWRDPDYLALNAQRERRWIGRARLRRQRGR